MNVVTVEDLTKSYRSGWPGRPSVHALSGLTLSIDKGEIYGFLGPNGAGKTTTIKILMGLLRSTSGKAEIFGKAAGDVQTRARIGFLPESPYFYEYLTAEEFLMFYGHLARLDRRELSSRVAQLLSLVGMTEARTRQLRKFSKGMLQRVGLAQALIHDPELVILDEPMSGLDPIGRKQIRDIILSLREQGKTVFFSSHIIPDVEMICDRVGIMMNGKLVATGRVDELVGQGQTKSVEIVCEGISPQKIAAISPVATRVLQRGRQALFTISGADGLDDILGRVRAEGGRLISAIPQKSSLEELFVQQAVQGADVKN